MESRERAQSLILAGRVRSGDEVIDKPGRQLPEDADLTVLQDPNPYVGRGGLKLERALETFHLKIDGKTAIDIGASTGGFTDCLLQNGARKVFAVDVGYGQLDWKLRSDKRVVVLDRTNARNLTAADLNGEAMDLAVIDVSFISLKLVVPPLLPLLRPEADLVALVKPQFEVGKDEVENKGIITDPEKHKKVLTNLRDFLTTQKWALSDLVPSPIKGQKGNQEYLLHAVPASRGTPLDDATLFDKAAL